MAKILVTGGAGFIGSHLVDALIDRGHQVRILDSLVPQVHNSGKKPEYLNREAEFVKGDVCDAEKMRRALEGVEIVFHYAAEVGVAQSMYEIVRYVRANDLGTAVLLEAMIPLRDKIKKLVVASSMTIYGEGTYFCESCDMKIFPPLRPNSQMAEHRWELECEDCKSIVKPALTDEQKPQLPSSVYAASKQKQEQYCLIVGRAYNIPTVALRYFNAYGTRQALSNPYTGVCAIFSSRLLNNQAPIMFEDGGQQRDFIHISDIVQANLLALESEAANYEAINIGTGVGTSIKKVSQMLAKGLSKDIEAEIAGKYREGDIRHCIGDISRARKLLGYESHVRLEDGIGELLEWVRKQKATDMVLKASNELAARGLVK